jgi:DMSO/TMAO reductase YedYZ heme-binding membrane subunit
MLPMLTATRSDIFGLSRTARLLITVPLASIHVIPTLDVTGDLGICAVPAANGSLAASAAGLAVLELLAFTPWKTTRKIRKAWKELKRSRR